MTTRKPSSCLCGFFFAVFRRCTGGKCAQEGFSRGRHFGDGCFKGRLVGLRRLAEAAYFAYKLCCSRPNLVVGCQRFKIKEWFDASAHNLLIVAAASGSEWK